MIAHPGRLRRLWKSGFSASFLRAIRTRQEIETAMNDFRLGKFGQLRPLDLGADLAIAGT
jgi:hypothetical protein